jgi:GNAT superfamily N-acetyltransferase
MQHIELSIQPIDGPVAAILLAELRAELQARYPTDPREPTASPPPDASATSLPRGVFLIARVDGRLAGCGCIEGLAGRIAEIKRVFVRLDSRRGGVASALVDELERTAIFHGVRSVHLDAGSRQPELMFLCSRRGYRFQSYSGDSAVASESVRFAKELTSQPSSADRIRAQPERPHVRPPLRRARVAPPVPPPPLGPPAARPRPRAVSESRALAPKDGMAARAKRGSA